VWVLADGRALYFDSNRDGDLDIYRATVDGAGTALAAATVSGLNTAAEESEPIATLDDKTIYFARKVSGKRKIYVAHRPSATGAWGAAAAVGELNASADESPTWISSDGCRIVISSERPASASATSTSPPSRSDRRQRSASDARAWAAASATALSPSCGSSARYSSLSSSAARSAVDAVDGRDRHRKLFGPGVRHLAFLSSSARRGT